MLFTFHVRKPKEVQSLIFDGCRNGAALHGDKVVEVDGYKGVVPEADGTIIMGIGGVPGTPSGARTVFDHYLAAGKRVIFWDKGYTRADRFRVSVDSFQPLAYLMQKPRPADRINATGIRPKPYKGDGYAILFDGASAKYCQWYGLGDCRLSIKERHAQWGAKMMACIRKHTDLPIIYRPRPSHNPFPSEYFDKPDLIMSQIELPHDLDRAKIVVSHGGNLGWDAVVAGKPHFAIDVSIARPVSETDWKKVGVPYMPSEAERWQWMCNVAYCQWSKQELANGAAWATVREQLAMIPPPKKSPPCPFCGGHGVEQIYGGHGTVLELPCSCEAGIRYGAEHPHLYALKTGGPFDANHDHDDGSEPVPDPA